MALDSNSVSSSATAFAARQASAGSDEGGSGGSGNGEQAEMRTPTEGAGKISTPPARLTPAAEAELARMNAARKIAALEEKSSSTPSGLGADKSELEGERVGKHYVSPVQEKAPEKQDFSALLQGTKHSWTQDASIRKMAQGNDAGPNGHAPDHMPHVPDTRAPQPEIHHA